MGKHVFASPLARHTEIYTLALTRVQKVVSGGQNQPQGQIF